MSAFTFKTTTKLSFIRYFLLQTGQENRRIMLSMEFWSPSLLTSTDKALCAFYVILVVFRMCSLDQQWQQHHLGKLLDMQILWAHPTHAQVNQKLWGDWVLNARFNTFSPWFWCLPKYENHCFMLIDFLCYFMPTIYKLIPTAVGQREMAPHCTLRYNRASPFGVERSALFFPFIWWARF